MLTVHLNYWAVLVAALVNIVIGSLWYSPVMFGKLWMKLVGKDGAHDVKKGMGKAMVMMVITALVMAFILAEVIYPGFEKFFDGVLVAFWLWLGLVATTTAAPHIYEGKSWKLYLMVNGYNLVSMLLMGGILAIWR